MLELVLVGLGAAFLFAVLLGRRDSSAGIALGSALLLVSLGTRGQTDRTGGALFIIILLILLIPIFRMPAQPERSFPTATLILMFGVAVLPTAVGTPDDMALLARIAVLTVLTSIAATRVDRANMRIILRYLLAAGYVHLAFAVVEAFQGRPVWGFQQRADSTDFVQSNELFTTSIARLEGATGHSILFGLTLAVAIFAVFTLRGLKFHSVAMSIPLIVGVAFSGSRSTILAIGLTLCVVILSKSVRLHFLVRIGLIGAVLVVLLQAADYISAVSEALQESGSFRHRLEGINSADELLQRPFLESLFGSGYGAKDQLFQRGFFQDSEFEIVDNQFVFTLGTLGIVGVAILCAFLASALYRTPPFAKFVVITLGIMMFSFDVMTWFFTIMLLAVLASYKSVTVGEPVAQQSLASNGASTA